jgi:hypothetical protein
MLAAGTKTILLNVGSVSQYRNSGNALTVNTLIGSKRSQVNKQEQQQKAAHSNATDSVRSQRFQGSLEEQMQTPDKESYRATASGPLQPLEFRHYRQLICDGRHLMYPVT